MSADRAHTLAVEAAKDFIKSALAIDLSVIDTIIACETFMVMALAYISVTEVEPAKRKQYVTEMIDAMTERANERVRSYVGDLGE